MRRHLRGIVIVAVCALLVQGAFLLVDRVGDRAPPPQIASARASGRAPSIPLTRGDARATVPTTGVVVLHLWATWCVPCRTELPVLLEAGAGAALFAVSLDEGLENVSAFFDGQIPEQVWLLADEHALEALSVRALPETLLLNDGEIVARAVGAQRWTRENLRAWLAEARSLPARP